MNFKRCFLIGLALFVSIFGFSQDIFTTIRQGNIEKTKQLIEADSMIAFNKNPRGFSPIHFAANFNKLEIAKLLVEKGVDPFIVGAFGRQAIHWAAASGSSDVLIWLHELGANLNSKDATEKTPLFLATTRRQKASVDFLLSKNVEIQTDGDDAFDLLYSAIIGNIMSITQIFIESDFDFNQLTDDGSNLLLPAALNGNIDLITTLASKGLDVNLLNDFGECALHISIIQKKLEAMKKLIELGADVNMLNFISKNALSFAIEIEDTEYADYLKLNGATKAKEFLLDNKYPGFEEPGLIPKLLAPGLISTPDLQERDAMFSPLLNEFYYSTSSAIPRKPMAVNKLTKTEEIWSMPETAKFSGKFNDAECFISSDNTNLYFISQRPPQGGETPSTWEIWLADRIDNEWGNFRLFDTTNVKGCFYPSITKEGEFLFTSAKNDLFLGNIINGKLDNIKKLGPEINTEGGEYNAMISPDGDYIITTSHGFEDQYGGGDLYISFRKEDKNWTQAINMGPEINSAATEYCPNISPDGKFFFFTSNKKGTEDIYWVSAEIIKELKEKNFNK